MQENENGFCLLDYQWLGFDLDHTLLRYNLPALYQLVYDCLWEYLVVKNNFYPEHLRTLPFRSQFLQKGLIIDKELGNVLFFNWESIIAPHSIVQVLKIAADRSIHQAYHGTKRLTREQITTQYPTTSIPFDGHSTPRFWSLTTYFETNFAGVFVHIVDWVDQGGEVPVYDTHCQRIYDAVFWNFAEWNQGRYFREVEKEPLKYVYPAKESRAWLAAVKEKGARLFLATNSVPEYTTLLLNATYGEGWESLFDIIIYAARKPAFFTTQQECWDAKFTKENGWQFTLTNEMKIGGQYKQGNITLVLDVAQKLSKEPHPKICYFGDHILYDVVVPRQTRLYAVAIVEEMEHDHHDHSNEFWGSFFSCEARDSWWHRYHKEHANLSVPSIAYLTKFPVTQRHTATLKSYRLEPRDL